MLDSPRSAHRWLIASLDSVLTSPVPEARIEALDEAARIGSGETERRLWDSGFVGQCNLGQFNLEDMLVALRDHLEVDLTEAHLMGLWSLAYEPNLEAIAELEASTGFRVGVIANETPLFEAAFDAYLPEVEMVVDGHWFSHRHRALTTDESFYRSVATELKGVTPTLVTGSEAERSAAAAAGWLVTTSLRSALGRLAEG